MHPKVFACLLLATLLFIGLSSSISASRQGGSRLNQQRTAAPGPEKTQRSDYRWPVRREWPGGRLSLDQKYLISQFLPHMYAAELAGKENFVQVDEESHDYPSWTDFGRRSLKDVNEDA